MCPGFALDTLPGGPQNPCSARTKTSTRTERPAILLEYYGRTDVGRKRDHNEDTFYFSKGDAFCVVADGMGGRKSGEVASKVCVDTLRKHFHYYAPAKQPGASWDDIKRSIAMVTTLLRDWIQKINSEIHKLGQQESKVGNMGTTVVLLYMYDRFGVIAHVGDSRLYRYREAEGMRRLTDDHSLVGQEVKKGNLSEEEARTSSKKNIVTKALGTRPTVEPDIQVIEVKDGDVFLLCSDGLSDLVVAEEMGNIVCNNLEHLDQAVDSFIDLANARGGKDNITVIMAQAFDLPQG